MNFYKLIVTVCVFCFFVVLGFFVGKEYVSNKTLASKKKTTTTIMHTHMHFDNNSFSPYTKKKEKMAINQVDLFCLAQNIYFEAANQSSLGRLAVGLVVMNRVKDLKYPDNICQVVKQKNQFSWFNDSRSNEPKNNRAWRECFAIAEDILLGKADFLDFEKEQ